VIQSSDSVNPAAAVDTVGVAAAAVAALFVVSADFARTADADAVVGTVAVAAAAGFAVVVEGEVAGSLVMGKPQLHFAWDYFSPSYAALLRSRLASVS